MNIKTILLTFCCLLFSDLVSGQNYQEGERFKVGLKIGPALSSLSGTALAKPSLKYGFTGGIYYRTKLRGGFHFQTEVNAGIRGARFNDNGPDGYTKINLMYVDAAQLILKDLKKDNHTFCLVMGVQPSFLVQSWVYNPYYQMSPAARDIALNTMDVFAVFGLQLNKKIIGLQSVIKIGLTNINRGLNMYDVSNPPRPIVPATNNSGTVRNISWETTLAF